VQLELLDVAAAQVGHAPDLGSVLADPAGQFPQGAFDPHHRRCA
jgi:hypothetical protein